MTFIARTFYTIACNRCECPFTEPDEETGEEISVVLMNTIEGADELAQWMRSEGWVAVGGMRHLCPPCAIAEQAAAMDRLAIEFTHDELPLDGGTP